MMNKRMVYFIPNTLLRQFSRGFCTRHHSNSTSSIDNEEVKKFQTLSKDWWNSSSEMQPLISMNKLRVPFIRDGLLQSNNGLKENENTDKPLNGLKILDVGCGGGFLSEPLARLGAATTGIDATEDLIKVAKEHMLLDPTLPGKLNYTNTTIEDFVVQNKGVFDAVVCSEVIEHVDSKANFIKNCVDCLNSRGSIFISTISQTCASRVMAIFAAEYLFRVVPKGTHEYDKFISAHVLQGLLEENNCTLKRLHGLTLNPITNTWHWIPSTDVNYILQAVKNEET